MLDSKKRWRLPSFTAEEAMQVQEQLGVSPLMSKLILSRGWTDTQVHHMLEIEASEFHDPFLLDGMEMAVERIHAAVNKGEKIRIYGDYDCDGVSSTVLMIYVLRTLGATFDYYIPNRFTEGYGLNDEALVKAKEDGVQLILTVDTGISSKEQIDFAQTSLGLDVIVTDHHEPPELLPQCLAVINPKKTNCTYPNKFLAGVGVAFKLGHALLDRVPYEMVDIAAIGTIADLVPLIGENRLIAHHGLKAINRTKNVGLEALLEISGLVDQAVDEMNVGFALGPRINASGRLGTADLSVQLLTSEDRSEAEQLAQEVNELNKQRQDLVNQMTQEATEWVEHHYPNIKPKVLVVAQEDWNEGVIGIVASRLVERYYVPTIVLSIDRETGQAKGSARSIEGFNIYKALCECQEWLPHFGGHSMAAGMSLSVGHIDHVRQRLAQIAEQWLTDEDFKPITSIDLSCTFDEITSKEIEDLARLAPYGIGNPKPMVIVENMNIKALKQVGADRNHLKCEFEQEEHLLSGIGFGLGEVVPKISMGAKVDVIGHLEMNEWNGTKKPQILISDLRVQQAQFFDWRGVGQLQKKIEWIAYDHNVAVCHFRRNQSSTEEIFKTFESIHFDETGCVKGEVPFDFKEVDTFVLFDLPQTFEQLQRVCHSINHGKRFYLLFEHQDDHYFSTIPEREHFKWYYAFLQQQETFDLDKNSKKLAEHKGWTVDAIQFMTKVFLELQFATIDKGKICLKTNATKKDLTQSKSYQQKQEEIRLEKELVYSSYVQVIQVLQKFMNDGRNEEAIVHGL